jgi:hypothetical protein
MSLSERCRHRFCQLRVEIVARRYAAGYHFHHVPRGESTVPDPNATRSAEPDDAATPSSADPGVTGSVADPAATTGGPGEGTFAEAPPASAQRYALGAEIARGGMGAVYRATDTAFDREVAVKVLLDKYAPTSGTARRFADEARITGQLQHPNIPAVHDLGTLPDGRPFLAMKLIKGQTLDDLLKARTDPSADRGRFVAAFEQLCQAVAYAHAHHVLHRDLKPGNVMVGAFGEVQVMDWGLAKVLGTREAETTAPTEVQSIRQTDSAFTQAGRPGRPAERRVRTGRASRGHPDGPPAVPGGDGREHPPARRSGAGGRLLRAAGRVRGGAGAGGAVQAVPEQAVGSSAGGRGRGGEGSGRIASSG